MATREDIVHDILRKKELRGIEHAFVGAVLEKELRRQLKTAKMLSTLTPRSSAYKGLVKAVRSVLRRNVSLYEQKPEHREALLAELRQAGTPGRRSEIIMHLLATHVSTNERLPFYDRVFDGIFSVTGKPESVIDVGCGLNPLAFPYDDTSYAGIEIDRALARTANEFFSITGREGQCLVFDANAADRIRKMPGADVAFVFKLLDIIDEKGHSRSERLMTALPAGWIVVSFPILRISTKAMKCPQRPWFEKMLKRLKFSFSRFCIPNEIFYICRRVSHMSQ